MHHVSAKFMPRLLSDDQKQNCVEINQEMVMKTFLRTL